MELAEWIGLELPRLDDLALIDRVTRKTSPPLRGTGARSIAVYRAASCTIPYERHWLRFFLGEARRLANGANPGQYRVQVYLCDAVKGGKELPDRGDVLLRRHINSGLCMKSGSSDVRVYVFRPQEARKVFFHEMLHAMSIMQRDDECPVPVPDLMRSWDGLKVQHPWLRNFQQELSVREAVTEALACALELKLRTRLQPATAPGALVSADLEHSRANVDVFLEWGGCKRDPKSDTHAIEYLLLKDIIYPAALDLVFGKGLSAPQTARTWSRR